MSESIHTPGPWEATEINCKGRIKISASSWHYLASVKIRAYQNGEEIISETGKANARLIASAPDMYEALEKIKYALENLGNGLPNNDFLAPYFLVIRAINKAKGDTNE